MNDETVRAPQRDGLIARWIGVWLVAITTCGCGGDDTQEYCGPVGCAEAFRLTISRSAGNLSPGKYEVEVDASGKSNTWSCEVPASGAPGPCGGVPSDGLFANARVLSDASAIYVSIYQPNPSVKVTVSLDGTVVGSASFQYADPPPSPGCCAVRVPLGDG